MNVIKEQQRINQLEIDRGISTGASWHAAYADSAYVYAGGLDFRLTEGDVITIFSQYGEIVDVNLVRDKKTGKSKGFAFVAYEDQRSTTLAVDNLSGSKLLGKTLKVDHKSGYKPPEEEVEEQRAMGLAAMGQDKDQKPQTKQVDIGETHAAAAEAARNYPHLQSTFKPSHGGSLSKAMGEETSDRLDADELWERRFLARMEKEAGGEAAVSKSDKKRVKAEKKAKKESKKARKEAKKENKVKKEKKETQASIDTVKVKVEDTFLPDLGSSSSSSDSEEEGQVIVKKEEDEGKGRRDEGGRRREEDRRKDEKDKIRGRDDRGGRGEKDRSRDRDLRRRSRSRDRDIRRRSRSRDRDIRRRSESRDRDDEPRARDERPRDRDRSRDLDRRNRSRPRDVSRDRDRKWSRSPSRDRNRR